MTSISNDETNQIRLQRLIFEKNRKDFCQSKLPTYNDRINTLDILEKMIINHIEEICYALQTDFGCRSSDWTFVADIFPVLSHIKEVKKNLRKWMKKEVVSSGVLSLTGQRMYIHNEPLGIVGIMSPFNAPVSLAFGPAIDAIAAGNRVMIKISESTANTSRVIHKLVEDYFKNGTISVIMGGTESSKVFASLPWDKFVFTGGSEVGKKILSAASENLTPVILELGGKSPCIILEDANIVEASEKISKVRQLNAGQVCISGDYVFIHEDHLEMFVDISIKCSESTYPSIIDNTDFTSIIDHDAYDRLLNYIGEAKDFGCNIFQANPMSEDVPHKPSKKIPLTIIVNPPANLMVSKNEIFGPILPVYTYQDIENVIDIINAKEKPLALYIFGRNKSVIQRIINSTSSGGVTVNDMLLHANNKMGFGGVGYSGMGRYKGGMTGYKEFSNPKSVFEQGFMSRFTRMFFPPFKNDRIRNMLRSHVGLSK